MVKSIGQVFNVVYQEFLRQNGLFDDVVEDVEYNGVLEVQKIFGEDLFLLVDENSLKEVSIVYVLIQLFSSMYVIESVFKIRLSVFFC